MGLITGDPAIVIGIELLELHTQGSSIHLLYQIKSDNIPISFVKNQNKHDYLIIRVDLISHNN